MYIYNDDEADDKMLDYCNFYYRNTSSSEASCNADFQESAFYLLTVCAFNFFCVTMAMKNVRKLYRNGTCRLCR